MLWRAALEGGAERVGWKIGMGIPEALERFELREGVIGHLTTATQLSDGAEFVPHDPGDLRAEIEVAMRVGSDGEVDGYATAIELVDVGRPPEGVERIVAGNVFHRAFLVGPFEDGQPGTARLTVAGEVHEPEQAPPDPETVIDLVSRQLASAGESLKPGDVIISGALMVVGVAPGDEVQAEVEGLGSVRLSVA